MSTGGPTGPRRPRLATHQRDTCPPMIGPPRRASIRGAVPRRNLQPISQFTFRSTGWRFLLPRFFPAHPPCRVGRVAVGRFPALRFDNRGLDQDEVIPLELGDQSADLPSQAPRIAGHGPGNPLQIAVFQGHQRWAGRLDHEHPAIACRPEIAYLVHQVGPFAQTCPALKAIGRRPHPRARWLGDRRGLWRFLRWGQALSASIPGTSVRRPDVPTGRPCRDGWGFRLRRLPEIAEGQHRPKPQHHCQGEHRLEPAGAWERTAGRSWHFLPKKPARWGLGKRFLCGHACALSRA